MRLTYFLIIYIFLTFCLGHKKVTAQNKFVQAKRLPALIPYREGDKWGFADSTGKIKVPPQYTRAIPFENGLAQIFSENGVGLMNLQGKEVLKPIYTNLILFDNYGFRVDNKEGKHGLVDLKGNEILPVKYDYAKFLDLPDVGKYLVIAGTAVNIPNEPNSINRNRRKLSLGVFDLTGKQILPKNFTEINYKKEGIIEACKTDTCQYFFIDGRSFLPPAVQRLSNFKKGIASICDATGCGYLNRKGEIFILKQYQAANAFSEGLAAVSNKNGKWGYIDTKGRFVSEPIFEADDELKYFEKLGLLNSVSNNSVAGELRNGLALVRQKKKFGFVGRDGKLLTPVEYDKISPSNYPGKYYLLKGNQSVLGKLDTLSGKFILSENPRLDIGIFSEGLASVYKDNLYGYIDKNLQLVIPYQFTRVSSFKNGIVVVAKPVTNGMRNGIIDRNNQVILPFDYGRIESVGPNLFKVQPIVNNQTVERWGLFDSETKHLTSIKYTSIGEYKDGVASFMIDDSFGLLNQNGQEVLGPIQIPNDYSTCDELKNGIIKICHKQSKKEGYMDIYGRKYFVD